MSTITPSPVPSKPSAPATSPATGPSQTIHKLQIPKSGPYAQALEAVLSDMVDTLLIFSASENSQKPAQAYYDFLAQACGQVRDETSAFALLSRLAHVGDLAAHRVLNTLPAQAPARKIMADILMLQSELPPLSPHLTTLDAQALATSEQNLNLALMGCYLGMTSPARLKLILNRANQIDRAASPESLTDAGLTALEVTAGLMLAAGTVGGLYGLPSALSPTRMGLGVRLGLAAEKAPAVKTAAFAAWRLLSDNRAERIVDTFKKALERQNVTQEGLIAVDRVMKRLGPQGVQMFQRYVFKNWKGDMDALARNFTSLYFSGPGSFFGHVIYDPEAEQWFEQNIRHIAGSF